MEKSEMYDEICLGSLEGRGSEFVENQICREPSAVGVGYMGEGPKIKVSQNGMKNILVFGIFEI